ncbi:hypothetical protein BKA70DRAFT_1198427 [Coprinopsis sp. MPI-PUGE-AT-0042]|nr:hypothetical protein BKA70DRAFT_1198427 [Coprinopsis sp. MPI-PUGE-AT-0042]
MFYLPIPSKFQINKVEGRPCTSSGEFLNSDDAATVPLPPSPKPTTFAPFNDRIQFDAAIYHYVKLESSASDIAANFDLLRAQSIKCNGNKDAFPWRTAKDLYDVIDSIDEGLPEWKTFKFHYNGPKPAKPPQWMLKTYELNTRDALALVEDLLASPEFDGSFDYQPYQEFCTTETGTERTWNNLFSGSWSWKQAVSDIICEDPAAAGSMFVPIVAGSDKTTVSVATGHQEYHPVYISLGNLHNTARRAKGNGVVPIAFLPIPKASKAQRKKPVFQRFCRQLYHSCLEAVFQPLREWMTKYRVVKCPDGHFRRAIFGLGPYIADYPEQVYLAGIVSNWCPKCEAPSEDLDRTPCAHLRSHKRTDLLLKQHDPGTLWDEYGIRTDYVPFTHFFPRANIHELLSPDLLHQLIKGTFKDHLVTWVGEYLQLAYGTKRAQEIIEDIDHRIAAVPPFPGLRRFPDGRDYNQWTGDDSKALMKVYIAAIQGYVPPKMSQCLATFMEACYIARRNNITATALKQFQDCMERFHELRQVFIEHGVRRSISLPRQHSLSHYTTSIYMFGSPNGLCSSMTESKHIEAVKKPWRRSNRYNALHQMLTTLTRLSKLDALRCKLAGLGMLKGSTSWYIENELASQVQDSGSDGIWDIDDDWEDVEDNEPEVGLGNEEPNGATNDDDDDDDDDLGPAPGVRSADDVFNVLLCTRAGSQALYPRGLEALAATLNLPALPSRLGEYLYSIDHPETDENTPPPAELCPKFEGSIRVHHSATATYYAPSDLCGGGGLVRERIRSAPSFHGHPRRDTVFVVTDEEGKGMLGLTVARVRLFFSLVYRGREHHCALVNWVVRSDDEVDRDTGMWVVEPEVDEWGQPVWEVISTESIARGAHLLPDFGNEVVEQDFDHHTALDYFKRFFVNCFVDHHVQEFITE